MFILVNAFSDVFMQKDSWLKNQKKKLILISFQIYKALAILQNRYSYQAQSKWAWTVSYSCVGTPLSQTLWTLNQDVENWRANSITRIDLTG